MFVQIDLNKPMKQVLADLSKHSVKTRVALTGTLIVARDIAHAKLKERQDNGEGLPDYMKKHPVYYAGPAKTPEVRHRPQTIKKNTKSTPNKSQIRRARAYAVTSFLSTDCELSTNPCSRFLYSLGALVSRTNLTILLHFCRSSASLKHAVTSIPVQTVKSVSRVLGLPRPLAPSTKHESPHVQANPASSWYGQTTKCTTAKYIFLEQIEHAGQYQLQDIIFNRHTISILHYIYSLQKDRHIMQPYTATNIAFHCLCRDTRAGRLARRPPAAWTPTSTYSRRKEEA